MSSPVRTIAMLLACAAVGGCRSDPSVALLEAEARWLEDQIWVLEEQYELKCQELESCRLAHQAASVDGQREVRSTDDPSAGASSRRSGDGSRPDEDDTPPIEPPHVEGLPDIGEPSPAGLPNLQVPDTTPRDPVPQDPLGARPSSFHALGEAPIPGDSHVTHIVLNKQLTGGYDRDGQPGDDGVMVVIEPRNAQGQFIPTAGEVTIKLIDPKILTPSRKTFAAWTLTLGQSAAKVRKSLLGRGIHLELPWPNVPPQTEEFELQVTFASGNGAKLTEKRTIHIDPPRYNSQRWTPVSDGAAQPAWSPDRR